MAHISRYKKNQRLKFGEVAVLELLKVTNGLDLDYGTQKVHSQSKNLLIPHYRPLYCSITVAPPFLYSMDFACPRGRGPTCRIISGGDYFRLSSLNPHPAKRGKSTVVRKSREESFAMTVAKCALKEEKETS